MGRKGIPGTMARNTEHLRKFPKHKSRPGTRTHKEYNQPALQKNSKLNVLTLLAPRKGRRLNWTVPYRCPPRRLGR